LKHGHLKAEAELFAEYYEKKVNAKITHDGQVEFRGVNYQSPSAAGAAAKQSIAGKFMPTNGWEFWHYLDRDGNLIPLEAAKQKYRDALTP
jgi:hypothetical protein